VIDTLQQRCAAAAEQPAGPTVNEKERACDAEDAGRSFACFRQNAKKCRMLAKLVVARRRSALDVQSTAAGTLSAARGNGSTKDDQSGHSKFLIEGVGQDGCEGRLPLASCALGSNRQLSLRMK
jgi:hypothetical protein